MIFVFYNKMSAFYQMAVRPASPAVSGLKDVFSLQSLQFSDFSQMFDRTKIWAQGGSLKNSPLFLSQPFVSVFRCRL